MTIDQKIARYCQPFIVVLVLSVCLGCSQYSLIKTGQTIQLGQAFQIKTSGQWSKMTIQGLENWTVDGPLLERLIFFEGVEDGQPLFPETNSQKDDLPLYKSSMNVLEVQDLIEASLVRIGAHKVEIINIRPDHFGSLEGFRLNFRFMNKSGLEYKGLVVGAKRRGRLLAIMYLGTALYYYQKYLPEVEEMIASVKIL